MTRLLVTGADGFVGRWLVRAARADGHDVFAAILPDAAPPAEWSAGGAFPPVTVVRADLREVEHLQRLASVHPDAVVHLAAIASGAAARQDPDAALQVNGAATATLADVMSLGSKPRFLLASSAEVYGAGQTEPIAESAARHPVSPYGISKAGAEVAVLSEWSATGLPGIVARAFPHTGPGQSPAYVLPALASRLREARRSGSHQVRTGNLRAVRDFLDVRDVVRAYLLLLERGVPGEVYNVASGVGRPVAECFATLARMIGVTADAVEDAALLRPGDIPVLIGDATKLRDATGWSPQIPFERTLQDLVDAQAD